MLVDNFVLSARKRKKRDIQLCWGLTTDQPLCVILFRLLEKGRREIEGIAEEMKAWDREEKKMNEREEKEEIITFPLYSYLLQG